MSRCPTCGASLLSDPDEPPRGASLEDLRAMLREEGHYVDDFDRVNETAAAWLLGMVPGSLRNDRSRDEPSIPFVTVGRRIYYDLSVLLEELAGH